MPAAHATATIEAARAAKDKVKRTLADRAGIVGVGVTRRGKGYAVKVNLARSADRASMPRNLSGVPVVFEVVGAVRKR